MRRTTQEKSQPKPGADAAPTVRILRVLDQLTLNGPMTLSDLLVALPFSRAAVWRALDTLRSEGWIRLRQNDGAFVLTEAQKSRLRAAQGTAAEAEAFLSHWMVWHAAPKAHYAVNVISGPAILETVETSAPGVVVPTVRRSVQDDAMLAAYLTMSRVELVRHLNGLLEFSDQATRRYIQTGALAAELKDLGSRAFVQSDVGVLLPFRPAGMRPCSVHIWPRSETLVPDSDLASLKGMLFEAPKTDHL